MKAYEKSCEMIYSMFSQRVRAWENTNDLILFTCFDMNDNDYRWFVRAEFVEGTSII